jgi:hypothetical protein
MPSGAIRERIEEVSKPDFEIFSMLIAHGAFGQVAYLIVQETGRALALYN